MFFLIQKPIGLSSFSVIAHLRKKFGIKKVGHTGTLDPLATGLLLVATDNSTKLIPYIDKAKKTYVFTVRMDGETPSCDLDTAVKYIDKNILAQVQQDLTQDIIEKTLQLHFSGNIEQVPPSYSAIRLQGQRAYDMVRAGQEVVIPKRTIEIFSSRIISYHFPEVTIEMEVSVGTYIRSIARDLGRKLGLSGYITILHRSKIEHLGESLAKTMEDLTLEDALSYETIFPSFGLVAPTREVLLDIRNGIIFPNMLGLVPGKKYLVQSGNSCVSLIDTYPDEGERNGCIRICVNNIQ